MKVMHILFPITLAFVLSACGNDSVSEQPTVADKETDTATKSTENKVSEASYVSPLPDDAPVINAALSAGYAPFEFKDEYGHIIGYDIDILRAIGEEAGFKVKFHDMPFIKIVGELDAGNYDIGMSSSFNINDHDKFLVSNPYVNSKIGYMVKENSSIATPDELDGKSVSVQKGSFLEKKLKDNPNITTVPETSMFLVFQSIFTDKSTAAIGEEPLLMYQSDQFTEFPMKFIPLSDKEIRQRVVISAKDNNQEIISKVNEGLNNIKSNGKYQKINEKWFGSHADSIAIH